MFFSVPENKPASTSWLFRISCSWVFVCSKDESAVVRYLVKSLWREFISLTCLWREEKEHLFELRGIRPGQPHTSHFRVTTFSGNRKTMQVTTKCRVISSLCCLGVLSRFPQTTCPPNNSPHRSGSFLSQGQLGEWGGQVSKLWFVRPHKGFSEQISASHHDALHAWGWRGTPTRGHIGSVKSG